MLQVSGRSCVMADMEPIARIAERMRMDGVKAAELSRRTGLHPSRLSQWLSGEGAPTLRQFALMVSALGMSADEALGLAAPTGTLTEDETKLIEIIRDVGHAESRRRLLCIPSGPHVIKHAPDIAAPERETPPPPARLDRERRGAG